MDIKSTDSMCIRSLSLSRHPTEFRKGFSLSHRGVAANPCGNRFRIAHTQTDRHTNTRRSNKCRMRGQITIFKDPYMVNLVMDRVGG